MLVTTSGGGEVSSRTPAKSCAHPWAAAVLQPRRHSCRSGDPSEASSTIARSQVDRQRGGRAFSIPSGTRVAASGTKMPENVCLENKTPKKLCLSKIAQPLKTKNGEGVMQKKMREM